MKLVVTIILLAVALNVGAATRSLDDILNDLEAAQAAGDSTRVEALMRELKAVSEQRQQEFEAKEKAYRNSAEGQRAIEDFKRLQQQFQEHQESLEYRIGIAARKGNLAQVKALHAKGAKINEYSLDPGPPLFEAIMKNQKEVVAWLLDNGAQLRVQGGLIMLDALDLAVGAEEDNSAMIRYLVSRGANLDQNDATIVTALMDDTKHPAGRNGSSGPNLYNVKTEQMGHGSPLWRAIDERKYKHARTLLELKANPNIFGFGFTPLMKAADQLDVEAIKLLLKFGADANLKGPHYITALQLALRVKETPANKTKRGEVIRLLQKAGATK